MPKVSVITSCYNAEAYIAQTIESVRSQLFQDWEMVIVDDGSRDRSADVVRETAQREPRIRLICQENRGAPTAKNVGIAASDRDCDYVIFLDADDLFKPGVLTFMTSYLDRHPEAGAIGCEYDFINGAGDLIAPSNQEYGAVWRYAPHGRGIRVIPDDEPNTPFVSLFCWCRVIPSATMVRRSVLDQTPGFNPELPMGHDIDMFLHCALYGEVHYAPQSLVQYRRHGTQMTAQVDAIRKGEEKLWGIWRVGKGLTPAQRQIVAHAWHFKETRFVPHLFAQWGRDRWQHGDYSQAMKCYARAARKMLSTACSSGTPVARGQ
jgi:glycosyltransferase involved in cell wall biosynthesis